MIFFFSPGMAEVTTSYLLHPVIKAQKVLTDPIHAHASKKTDLAILHQDVLDLQKQN